MTEMTVEQFNAYLKNLFPAAKRGQKRIFHLNNLWWKYRAGIDGSLRVAFSSDGPWRTPTERQMRLFKMTKPI